jgi:hypothetical protein
MIRSHGASNAGRFLRGVPLLVTFVVALAFSQTSPIEHKFQVPQAALDKALHDLKVPSPGRIPILDGFVTPDVPMLGNYQRAYYQYTIETHPLGSGATSLRVAAKITAWFSSDHPEESEYRVLPSNGRLESDLVERLGEVLQQKAETVAIGSSSSVFAEQSPRATSASSSAFHTSLPMDRMSLAPPSAQDLAQQKTVQQLTEQAANLEEVLHNQTRPNDLVAVLKSGTPVFAKPIEGSPALFQADSEDEFKIVDQSATWVHVQVSGISRGWIRRSDVEMPGEASPAVGSSPTVAATSQQPQTHEDTSLFPGDWSVLRGRMVRIIWVHPDSAAGQGGSDNWRVARSIFRDAYTHVSGTGTKIEGVVIVIDSPDGGMVAATTDALRRWNTGAIPDAAFRKECWADPPETLRETAQPEHTTKSGTD